MRTRSNRRGLALAMMLALLSCVFASAEQMTVNTATDGAVVYGRDGGAPVMLPANAALTWTDVNGGLCRVASKGRTGYMDIFRFDKAPMGRSLPQEEDCVTAYVAAEGAAVYDAEGNIFATLSLNDTVTVIGSTDNAWRVAVKGRAGYMRRGDLSATPIVLDLASDPREQSGTTAYAANPRGAEVRDADGETIATLAVNTAVRVTAVKGEYCRVAGDGRTGYMRTADLAADRVDTAVATVVPASGTAVEMDWWTSDIRRIFAKGSVVKLTDVQTGISWLEKRYGGSSHADSEPLTAADTAALKQVYGGEWSWDCRAVFVTIDGVNYAASINGMPHEDCSIHDNGFDGHHCIHFTNSRVHTTDEVSANHQAAIRMAASMTMGEF